MKRFIEGEDRSQITLFPNRLEDYVAEDKAFIDEVRTADAKHLPAPRNWLRYWSQMQTNGRFVGHGGYGGQYLLAEPESGVSVAFFSVLEDEGGYDQPYIGDTTQMCKEIRQAGRGTFWHA